MKLLRDISKKLTYFDILALSVLFVLALAFFFFFSRKVEYITIRVKVTDQDVLYAQTQPATWYANRFEVGDTEKDTLGRVTAEIVGVERFNVSSDRKALYLDLKIRALFDSRSKLYSAKGKSLNFGTPLRFNFSKVTFDSLVTDSPSIEMQKDLKVVDKKVVALLRGIKPEEITIEPLVIQSVKKGDKVMNSNGEVLAEVLDVKIRPAERVTQTDKGELLLRADPLYKDALFTLNIRTKILDNEPFMFDNIPFKIGEWVPLNFENVSLWPQIVEILP